MPNPVVAIAASSVGSAAISSSSASKAADAQSKASGVAADATVQANRESIESIEKQRALTESILSPYYTYGENMEISGPLADIDKQIEDLRAGLTDGATAFTEAQPVREPDRFTYRRDSRGRGHLKRTLVSPTETDEEYNARLAEWQAKKDAYDFTNSDQGAAKLAELEAQRQSIIDNPQNYRTVSPYSEQLALTGILGDTREKEALQGLMDSPSAQYLQNKGESAIDRRASATGQLGGSERLKQISTFNQQLANEFMQNRFNQLGALTGVGLNAAQAMAGVGGSAAAGQASIQQNTGTNLANLALGAGQNRADAYSQQGEIAGGLLNDLGGIGLGSMQNKQINSDVNPGSSTMPTGYTTGFGGTLNAGNLGLSSTYQSPDLSLNIGGL